MCINYTNEKLHKLYISAVFDAEKAELLSEGLDYCLENLVYPENTGREVIQLLSKSSSPVGIFKLVNDAAKLRPSGEQLVQTICNTHKDNPKFSFDKRRIDKERFTIHHSAKDVIYTGTSFGDKNIDDMSASLENLIEKGTDESMALMFREVQEDTEPESPAKRGSKSKGGAAKLRTIWGKFYKQINELMDELSEPLFDLALGHHISEEHLAKVVPCELHFIRCIKPNEAKKPEIFSQAMTKQQMTYMGVLESIRVKQINFPYRARFMDFYQNYEVLGSQSATMRFQRLKEQGADFKELSVRIMNEVFQGEGQGKFEIGQTKIFMKAAMLSVIEDCLRKVKKKKDACITRIKYSFYIRQQRLSLRAHQIKASFCLR